MAPDGKRSIDSIDLVKFIASVMLFILHFYALADFRELYGFVSAMTRWAVPFFFISSSYFLFTELESCGTDAEKRAAVCRFSRRLFRLYLAWGLFNLPYILYDMSTRLAPSVEGSLLRKLVLLVKDYLLTGCYFGSWYIVSVIVSVWIVFFLSRILSDAALLPADLPRRSFRAEKAAVQAGGYADINARRRLGTEFLALPG